MKKTLTFTILLFVAAFASLRAATITSAQDGNWSATSTWVGGVVPGDGDSAVLAHNVTVDASVTVGTSDVAGTAAITINNGDSLIIANDVTLIVRGGLVNNSTGGGSLTMLAGAQILFDDAATVSGNEQYELVTPRQFPVEDRATPALKIRGTAENRCKIGKVPGSTSPEITVVITY